MAWCKIEDESREVTKTLTQGVFALYLLGSCKIREEQPTWRVHGPMMRLEGV